MVGPKDRKTEMTVLTLSPSLSPGTAEVNQNCLAEQLTEKGQSERNKESNSFNSSESYHNDFLANVHINIMPLFPVKYEGRANNVTLKRRNKRHVRQKIKKNPF